MTSYADKAAAQWTNYIVAPSGCWEWDGYLDPNGYGRIYDRSRPEGKRVEWAHRSFFERHNGPLISGMEIDHVCVNPPCVNPAHLEQVTRAENVRRIFERNGTDDRHLLAARLRMVGMTYAEIAEALRLRSKRSAHLAVRAAVAKGLVSPEDVPPVPKLNEVERDDIVTLYGMGIPQTEIGRWYRVDSSQISRICAGLTSGHSRRKQVAA